MPDERSGLAPAEQNTTSWLGQSDSVMDLVGRFLNIKQHQKNQALQELQSTVELSKAGFPIDPKTFAKLVKKSGLPIATDDKTLSAFYGTQNKAIVQGDEKGGQPQGGGQPQSGSQMQVPSNADPFMRKALEAGQRAQASGKSMSGEEFVAAQINAMGSRALQLMNTKAATDQQKAENMLTVEQLVTKSLAGDNEARGRLMANGQVPFDFQYEQWSTMSDKQRGDMLDVAAGHESDAQRLQRATNISQSLMSSGRVTDPESAMKIGKILAAGGEVPPELRSKMKPRSFSDLKDEVLLGSELQEMGVPSNKLGSVLAAAQAGGLENALPGNLGPSFNERRLKLEEARLGVEEARYQKETEIAARMTAAENRKGITDAEKAQLEEFKSYYEIARAMYGKEGKNIPEDLRKGMIDRTAKALNLETEEVDTFWHFLTGGKEIKIKKPAPKMSTEGQATIDKFTGGGEPDKKDKAFKSFIKGGGLKKTPREKKPGDTI